MVGQDDYDKVLWFFTTEAEVFMRRRDGIDAFSNGMSKEFFASEENANRSTCQKRRTRAFERAFTALLIKRSIIDCNHTMTNLVLDLYSQATQNTVLLAMSLSVATAALSALLVVRWKRMRDSWPAYNEIPSSVLHHMATKKELKELDNKVDVIVSCNLSLLASYAIPI